VATLNFCFRHPDGDEMRILDLRERISLESDLTGLAIDRLKSCCELTIGDEDDIIVDGKVRGDLGEREEIVFNADGGLLDFGGDSMALLLLSLDDNDDDGDDD
jgi:hypothetical protein